MSGDRRGVERLQYGDVPLVSRLHLSTGDDASASRRQLPPLSPSHLSSSSSPSSASLLASSRPPPDPFARGAPRVPRREYQSSAPPPSAQSSLPSNTSFHTSSSTFHDPLHGAALGHPDTVHRTASAPGHTVHTPVIADYTSHTPHRFGAGPDISTAPTVPTAPTATARSTSPFDSFITRNPNVLGPAIARESPILSPRLRTPDIRERRRGIETYEQERSLPANRNMTGARIEAHESSRRDQASWGSSSVGAGSGGVAAIDYERDVKKARYESPPPEMGSHRPRLSPSPNHPTPSSITALLSNESSSPRAPLSVPRSTAPLPPITLGLSGASFLSTSPVSRSTSYVHSAPPPPSALLQMEASAGPSMERLHLREEMERESEIRSRRRAPTSLSASSRPDSPPIERAHGGERRRYVSQPSYETTPRHRESPRHPSGPEVWITLAAAPRRNYSSWPDERVEAYRTGYNDAMRSVQDGAVEIGGASCTSSSARPTATPHTPPPPYLMFRTPLLRQRPVLMADPHPGIVRRPSPEAPTVSSTHYPSPAYTDPTSSRRRDISPDYPTRPSAPSRAPTYPPHRLERRHSREHHDYPSHNWIADPLSPRHRGHFDSPAHEHDRHDRWSSSNYASGAGYHGDGGYRFAGPSRPTRQLISCYPCRTRKLKCDGQRPCGQCVRRNGAADCKYAEKVRRRGKGKRQVPSGSGSQNSEDRDEAHSDSEVQGEEESAPRDDQPGREEGQANRQGEALADSTTEPSTHPDASTSAERRDAEAEADAAPPSGQFPFHSS